MQRPSRQLNFEAVKKWAESLSTEDRARWLDNPLGPACERAREPTAEQQAAPEQQPVRWLDGPLEPDCERAEEPTAEQRSAPEQKPAQRPDSPLEPDYEPAREPAVEQQPQEQEQEQERQPLLPPGSIVLLTVVLLVGAVFISWLW